MADVQRAPRTVEQPQPRPLLADGELATSPWARQQAQSGHDRPAEASRGEEHAQDARCRREVDERSPAQASRTAVRPGRLRGLVELVVPSSGFREADLADAVVDAVLRTSMRREHSSAGVQVELATVDGEVVRVERMARAAGPSGRAVEAPSPLEAPARTLRVIDGSATGLAQVEVDVVDPSVITVCIGTPQWRPVAVERGDGEVSLAVRRVVALTLDVPEHDVVAGGPTDVVRSLQASLRAQGSGVDGG